MEITFVLAAIILFYVAIVSLQLWKSSQRLTHHLHVLPLAKALPVQGALIQMLIDDMAKLEDIQSPNVFIYRARLPNAYVAAIPLRPELFLSDEALEQASHSTTPLECLAQLIGHELAHIKFHHVLYHAPIMYIAQSGNFLFLPLRKICQSALNRIEVSADQEGARITKRYINQA